MPLAAKSSKTLYRPLLCPRHLYIDKRMGSSIETKSDEHVSLCNHQTMFSEQESKLFVEKQRYEILQTELEITKFVTAQEAENHKRECFNLKETISRLEVERNQLREREAKNQETIKSLFEMVEKYDKEFMEKLNEFMKKYGNENGSINKRNVDISVKKEFDGEMNDETPNKENDMMMFSRKRAIREMWEKENCFTDAFTPFRLGIIAEEKGKIVPRQKKIPQLSDKRSSPIVSEIDVQILGKRSKSYYKRGVYTRRTSNTEQWLNAIKTAEKMQGNLNPMNPSFIKSMSLSHVAGSFYLTLDSEFCKKNLTSVGTYSMILEDDIGLEFEVKYLSHDCALSGGWRGFAIAHKLELHDVIIFELCEPRRFKVYIIKAIKGGLCEDSHDKIAKRLGTEEDGDQNVELSNFKKIRMEKHVQVGVDRE